MTRPTRRAPTGPIPDYRAALQGEVKGLRIGLIRHFYERDNEANAATREAIDGGRAGSSTSSAVRCAR